MESWGLGMRAVLTFGWNAEGLEEHCLLFIFVAIEGAPHSPALALYLLAHSLRPILTWLPPFLCLSALLSWKDSACSARLQKPFLTTPQPMRMKVCFSPYWMDFLGLWSFLWEPVEGLFGLTHLHAFYRD